MTMKKLKKGDTVLVTAGKDKGKSGEIIKVFPKDASVIVKGINMYKRHMKPREEGGGGIVERERALPVAKVMLMADGKPTRVGLARSKDGVKRINKKTGESL